MHVDIVRRPAGNADGLPASLHPVLRRVLAARGITQARDLELSLAGLLSAESLKGIAPAAELLADALARDARILIVGDFDADGATATALGVRALRAFGAQHVDYLVPNRFEFGYGLTPEIVAIARERAPDVLVTVDNGISSLQGVAAARAAGMRVVITDHHLPGDSLPDADAIVNPNQPGDLFPSKALAGVGVMFYLMTALRQRLRTDNWFAPRGLNDPNLARFLDLVALGTVADVVPLDANNRILVEQGLRRIRAGHACPGLLALMDVAGRDFTRTRSGDLGYSVAPRLNAAGRLTDMTVGIELLLCDDARQCRVMAGDLDALNQERKAIQGDMQAQADVIIESLGCGAGDVPTQASLCLFDADWHQGVVGILAGRIKDRLHRPVVVFAPGGDGEIKGSARSVPGLHIRDAFDTVAVRCPGLLQKFGGHAMAAGLTLRTADLDAFSRAFHEVVAETLGHESPQRHILTDGEIDGRELTLALAQALYASVPWGQGCPEPLFDGEFELLNKRLLRGEHVKLTLQPQGRTTSVDALAFNADESVKEISGTRVRAAYRLDVNDYRGVESLQLILEHVEPV